MTSEILKIVCIADTHGYTNTTVPNGDVLIHCGDATMMGAQDEIMRFLNWFLGHPHKHKLFIAGNHDMFWRTEGKIKSFRFGDSVYLENSFIEVDGLKIWGTPVQPMMAYFAFGEPPDERRKLFSMIPDNLDILITHCPPYDILDEDVHGIKYGCPILKEVVEQKKPKYHVFGHVHGGYGVVTTDKTTYINCSFMDDNYRPINEAKVIEIDDERKASDSRIE